MLNPLLVRAKKTFPSTFAFPLPCTALFLIYKILLWLGAGIRWNAHIPPFRWETTLCYGRYWKGQDYVVGSYSICLWEGVTMLELSFTLGRCVLDIPWLEFIQVYGWVTIIVVYRTTSLNTLVVTVSIRLRLNLRSPKQRKRLLLISALCSIVFVGCPVWAVWSYMYSAFPEISFLGSLKGFRYKRTLAEGNSTYYRKYHDSEVSSVEMVGHINCFDTWHSKCILGLGTSIWANIQTSLYEWDIVRS